MDLKCKIITIRSIAVKLYNYFSREAKRGHLFHDICDPLKRTQGALGIQRWSLRRWLQETSSCTDSMSSKRKKAEKIDDFDKDVIKRTIIKMFQDQEVVTMRKLRGRLQIDHDISVSKTNLWKIVRTLGFTFRKSSNGRNRLCEKAHLVEKRRRYLRQVKEKRNEGYDIVYLDETWVNAHHTFDKEWQSKDGTLKRQIPSSKGKRIIVAHAGSRHQGLIANSGLVYQSYSTDNRDYHTEMNGQIFKDWLERTLLPSLDRPSCLVMDNASYHNIVSQEDRIPTSSSKKEEIKSWLEKENIPFDSAHLKPELLSLVRRAKKSKVFDIDKTIHMFGHTCLRLPPYHSHLNPIELVWAKVKGKVAMENKTFKLPDIKEITCAAMNDVDKEYFSKCEDHVLRLEDEYWQNEGLRFIQPDVVINPLETSDSELD